MSDPVETILSAMREARPDVEAATRLATVTGGGADQVFVRFDGESIAGTRPYKRLADYYPVVGDRVLMVRSGSTWVVAGKVGQGPDTTGGIDVPNMPQSPLYARLQRTGNRVDYEAAWRVTATLGAVSFWLSLPYPVRAPGLDLAESIGRFSYRRSGVSYATGLVCLSGSASIAHFTDYNNNRWSGTSPYAIAAPDDFWVSLSYFTTD